MEHELFSRASISLTLSAHFVRITRAWRSIWSLSSFERWRIEDQASPLSLFKSMFLDPCRESGVVRESTSRYGFRIFANMRERVVMWCSYFDFRNGKSQHDNL